MNCNYNETILGIETSCDETSIAVIKSPTKIIFHIVASQEKIHKKYFGVVPELASREHITNLYYLIEKLRNTNLLELINAVAVTVGPGLMGSLLVGWTVAQTIATVKNLPIIGINHLEGHIFSAFINCSELEPPFIALIVSGGHTELVIVEDFGKYVVLGKTRDDAAGEAFDKVARLLHQTGTVSIGYPGGPAIERLAKFGNPDAIKFPRPYMWESWDFSFSGLKTAVVYYVRDHHSTLNAQHSTFIYDICASFQQAVVDTLVDKTLKAANEFKLKRIVVCGGVASNEQLRKQFSKKANGIKVYFPAKKFCTDNAAMIAVCGYYKKVKSKKLKSEKIHIDPNLGLKNWG